MASWLLACHDVYNYNRMKYILLIISAILIITPIHSTIKCLQTFETLTNYGMGVFIGGLFLLLSGSILMYFTFKSLDQKKNT